MQENLLHDLGGAQSLSVRPYHCITKNGNPTARNTVDHAVRKKRRGIVKSQRLTKQNSDVR